ncbi:MAG: hypothetical protein UW07_C0001G0024 [Candidatus Nomurabacteria bacterium GW2011_GWF2_43_8]|uniref:PPC domain-containing protein n=1 Tax=Candidatus Nomurabacteria bacterium GW2011_GWF2_43_8 TaxID=1618779 RepID=A0A0G1HZZ5_9BACT|nr:MAG: hypothetical protein UW07_C0001G0024 [Candidatus Nomurabacteria bacterium GW2011_GWF2_43_8]
MKYKKVNAGYFIKLEKGEEIIQGLTQFCEDNNIRSGSISGVGGTDNVAIKYYDLEKGEYLPKRFSGQSYEIVSLNGNISLVEDKPFVHLHIMLGDSDYRTFGGHLGSAVVDITCEIAINMSDSVINRKFNNEFKVNFWDF